MYGTFLFGLASPVVALVARSVASFVSVLLGSVLCAGGLLVQVCAPLIAFRYVWNTTDVCLIGQHWAACHDLLCGLAALGAALSVYFVADICFSVAATLGVQLMQLGMCLCFCHYPCNHA